MAAFNANVFLISWAKPVVEKITVLLILTGLLGVKLGLLSNREHTYAPLKLRKFHFLSHIF